MKYVLKEIILSEVSLERMLSVHSDAGYIIITAFRGGDSDPTVLKQNYINNAKLKNDIKKSGYSYFPVWGGFVETDKDGKQHTVREQSFVVTNFKGKTQVENSEELRKHGIKWCKLYGQESFLYKPAGKETKAYYLTDKGAVDFSFNSVSPTTSADMYFSSLNKSRLKNSNKKSFTYREGIVYMAKSAQSLHEAYGRKNEILFNLD